MHTLSTNSELLASLPTDSRLLGKKAIVTGSTSGIGEAIARVLAASGAEVVVSGRDAARAQQVVKAITWGGGKAHLVPADLAGSYDALRTFAREATAALGGQVDVLVNNAGVYPVTPTEALLDADLEAILDINIRAPHVLVGELALGMVERGSGSIVNIGSWMGRIGTANGAMYTASKAAIEQMTRNWAAEYGPRGVRVNTVAPGATLTPGNAEFSAALDAMTAGTAAGRPVRPIDIAYAVRFLVTEEAAFIHGTVLDVDGGMNGTRLNF
ncbi:SDR family NAD(P)-dependent oxidoreductase [Deinococcus marmoris]|uniref:Enoyl-acyl-carrier-protein reductase [NADPH] n=1 Tax=Deinococcus marmoris TaxID=249408 RepID=A0A1U7P202_9DEIO|nr:SDR family oxidoreductase [Deinococcus marmoris]OLV19190.1 Enoyl-acyl-carrier-protein reductase [NADPH] [Deinococcus marmoris]